MRLSVITPTQNRLAYLKENIASVKASVLAGADATLEQVVLASGSTDGTADWFMSADGPENVLFLSEDRPLPPGQARNLAIAAAAGEWIMPLDDDDILLQRAAYGFAEAIGKHPQTQWFVSGFLRVDEQLRYIPADDYYPWQFDSPKAMLEAIFRSEHFIQGNVCFAKSLFDAVGGYNEARRTAEDLELYCRFLLDGALPVALPLVSHLHRTHQANTSKGIGRDEHFADLRQIYAKLQPGLDALGVRLSEEIAKSE